MRYCYSGEELKITKIKFGDSLQECVEKINDFLLKKEDIDLSWLEEFKDELCEKPSVCIECTRNSSLVYCGAPLPIIGVQSGDHYDLVFEKIDEYLSTIGGSVVITNSDDSYLVEVNCGQEIVLPNIDNIDSNGSIISTPAQTPFTCTPQITTEIIISDENGNELAVTSTDYTVSNSIYQLQNSNSTILLNGQILAEGSELIIAPDATIAVFDSLGNTINTGIIASGSNGTMTIIDSTAILVDSFGNTIGVYSIPAQGSITITAPDTPIDVDINGINVVTGTITDVELNLIDQDSNVVPFTQVGDDIVVDNIQIDVYVNGDLQDSVIFSPYSNEIINITN